MLDTSRTLFESFLDMVVNGGVFSSEERDRTGNLNSDKVKKEIEAGRRIETRTPWLMTLSGKGGYAEGAEFEKRAPFRNVTLLDHLVSVTRGAAVFAEIDLTEAGIQAEDLRIRIARIIAVAFLHDADKMLDSPRKTLTGEDIGGLLKRYRVDSFLEAAGAQTETATLLSMINAVEVTRSDMLAPGQKILRDPEKTDALYIRLADRLDGLFLDTRCDLSAISEEIDSFEGVRTKVLKGWTALRLRSPQTPFLLDQLQAGASAASVTRAGMPPLIEVHHDGELLLVLPEDQVEAILDEAITRAGRMLQLDMSVQTNPRGGRDILDGRGCFHDLLQAVDAGYEAAKALFVHRRCLESPELVERFDHTFSEAGFCPSFSGLDSFKGQHFQPWALIPEDETIRDIRRKAAALAILLGCADPKEKTLKLRIPDEVAREVELAACLAGHDALPPDWISEEPHKGSRQTLLAVWATIRALEDMLLSDALFGTDGLAVLWLEGDENRAGLVEKIADPGTRFVAAAQTWLSSVAARCFIPGDENGMPGRCHFTNLPVGTNARIDGKTGIGGLKVSAFSGREGRPESHESARSQTLLSPFAAAEHKLRSLQGKLRAVDVPAHVSSPASPGLFAALNLNRDLSDESVDLDHYDIHRQDPRKGRPVFADTQRYRKRNLFARHVAIPKTTEETVDFVRMMLESAWRLGRPVHVFQGLPEPVPDFVYFDMLPAALRKAFGSRGLRLEQIPENARLLRLAGDMMSDAMQNVGLETVLRFLDPDTRLGAACEAVTVIDRLPDDKRKTQGGLRAALMNVIEKEFEMESAQDDALLAFAGEMTRVQAAPARDASNAERSLGLRLALEAVEGCLRLNQASPDSMIAAIAGRIEEEFDRSARLKHRGSWKNLPFPRQAALEAAEIFVTRTWPEAFGSAIPASKNRKIAFAIYQVAFEKASWRKKQTDGESAAAPETAQ